MTPENYVFNFDETYGFDLFMDIRVRNKYVMGIPVL